MNGFQRLRGLMLSNSRTQAGHRSIKPSVTLLEDRTLQTITGVWAYAKPQKLVPNGKYVPIVVSGEVTTSRTNEIPSVVFQVIDQYRQVEPGGKVKLTQQKPGDFVFRFTINLQARQSSTFQSARLYSITLGYQDSDNGAGLTVPVIVPKYYAPAPAQSKQAAGAPKKSG